MIVNSGVLQLTNHTGLRILTMMRYTYIPGIDYHQCILFDHDQGIQTADTMTMKQSKAAAD